MRETWLVDARTFGSRPTGVGTYAFRHVRRLLSEGRDVALVTDVTESAAIRGLAAQGVPVRAYGRRVYNSVGVLGYFRFVRKVVAETRPDVFWQPNNLQPFRPTGAGRVIVTIHDTFGLGPLAFGSLPWQLYCRLSFRRTIRNATELWYNSRQTKREVEARSERARRLDGPVVYPITSVTPAPDAAVAACRAKFGRYFLYLGNVETRKGADVLLDAYRLYRTRGGTASLVFAGLERDVHPTPGDGVSVLGYVSDGEKAALLGAALALVVPSRAEGYGMQVAEAAALGITCLASDLPVFGEIDPTGRVTFPCGDVAALASLLANARESRACRDRNAADATSRVPPVRRILYLSPFGADDLSCGAAQRSHFLGEALRRLGDVTFVQARELEPRGSLRRLLRRAVSLACPGLLLPLSRPALGRFDAVVVRYARTAAYYSAWRFGPLLVDVDDVPTDVCPRWCRFLFRRWTAWVLRQAVGAWVANPADVVRLRRLAGAALRVYPLENIACPPKSGYRFDAPRANRVMTVAHLGYPPNYRGIDRFLKARWPAMRKSDPTLAYRIIGKGLPPRFARRWKDVPGVELAGFVEDIDREYEECRAVVCPVETGGGTNVKVLEAIAHGREVIAPAFARRGIGDRCGTFAEFAAQAAAPFAPAQRRIPVAFSADERYLLPLEIAIRSLLETRRPTTEYDVVVLVSDLGERSRKRLLRLFPGVRTVSVSNAAFAGAPISWLSLSTYNRLLLAETLPEYDRVIWSDADVVFRDDLTAVYEADYGDFDWAGVAMERRGEKAGLHNHFPENGNAFVFAAGFMVANTKAWRERNLPARFAEIVRTFGDRLTMHDLDILNLATGRIAALPFRYCVFESVRDGKSLAAAKEYAFLKNVHSDAELADAKAHPAVVHYCGINPKVWRRSVLEMPAEYRLYWETSPFRPGWLSRRIADLKFLTRGLRGRR